MYLQLFITRKESRITQKQLASVLNIHPQSYHLKENGKADFTLVEAIKLSNHFGKSLDSLFGQGGATQ